MLAILLAGLLAAMAPSAFANQGNISLNADLVDAPEKGWYSSGDVVSVSGIISNNGDSTSITVDPSCDEVLRVWKDSLLILDGTLNCLGQSRGLDIDANSDTVLETLTWDLKNSEGEYVPSGDYVVEYYIAGEGLSSTINIHVQTPFNVPEELEMTVIASARDGVHAEGSPSILTVRLTNTHNERVVLDFQDCSLVVNNVLLGECGPDSLRGMEVVTIAQIPIELTSGENKYSVSVGDSELRQDVTINAIEDEDQGVNSGQLGEMTLNLQLPGDTEFEELEIFSPDILLKNIKVDTFNGLIVDFVRSNDAVAIIRGLRHVSDFEFEFQMAMMNFNLNPNIKSMFMMPDEKYIHLNSTVIKDVGRLGGNISDYVPKCVEHALYEKYSV